MKTTFHTVQIDFPEKNCYNEPFFKKIKVEKVPKIMNYLYKNIYNNKDIIMELVKHCNSSILQYVNPCFKNDPEIIFQACTYDVRGLKYASDTLKNNKDFVMKCVSINGGCIWYASDELKNDKDIVIKSFDTEYDVYDDVYEEYSIYGDCISDNLRADKMVTLAALKSNNSQYIALKAIKANVNNFELLDETLKNDPEVIIKKHKYEAIQKYNILPNKKRKVCDV